MNGITIILLLAVGLGYFFYQKYRGLLNGDGDSNMGIGRAIRRKMENRVSNTRQQQSSPTPYQAGALNREPARYVPPASATNRPGRPLVPASRENITEMGPMIYFANNRHGSSDKEYRFNYKKVGDSWRAYIIRTPGWRGRDSGLAITHRLHDTQGHYVCWDRPVNTLKDMQTISRIWADSIQEYIATGKRFG